MEEDEAIMRNQSKMWIDPNNKKILKYHIQQIKQPYRSTVKFCDWLKSLGILTNRSNLQIADIASGSGANIIYMSKQFPRCHFTGIDINRSLIKYGNRLCAKMKLNNCYLKIGDLYKLDSKYIGQFDGIMFLQTLSFLPEYKQPLRKLAELKSKWLALSSLFFNGKINFKIRVQDFAQPLRAKPYTEEFYNTYPLPHIKLFLKKLGYKKIYTKPFILDIDLPKPNGNTMGTYTEKLKNGKRIQISGPLLMNWYFIYAER